MNEISRINAWIYGRLTVDATIAAACETRVYDSQAPEKVDFPFVVFNLQASSDHQGMGVNRVLTRPLYQVKVVSKGPPDDDARDVADRIDEVIGKAVRQVLNGYLFSARREEILSLREKDQDSAQVYHHLGGLYRIWCSQE